MYLIPFDINYLYNREKLVVQISRNKISQNIYELIH